MRIEILQDFIKEFGEKADKKYKKLHNEYKNKDYFLEGIQSKIEAVLSDIEYYKSK